MLYVPTEAEKTKMVKLGQFLVKFNRDDVAHSIESGFIDIIRRGTTHIRCSKQFTPEVQLRRKKALAVRYDLKASNQITKGFIDYPAKLLVMLPGADRYTLHSSY